MGDTFEVDITNTGPSTVDIADFLFEITTTSSDVEFTDVTDATTTYSYIFNGNSEFGPDIAISGPGQTIDANDNVAPAFSYTALDSGETLGLGLVFFSVSPTAPIGEAVTVSFNLDDSSLADQNGNSVSIDGSQSGTINIVPEPATVTVILAGLGLLFARRRFARDRQA